MDSQWTVRPGLEKGTAVNWQSHELQRPPALSPAPQSAAPQLGQIAFCTPLSPTLRSSNSPQTNPQLVLVLNRTINPAHFSLSVSLSVSVSVSLTLDSIPGPLKLGPFRRSLRSPSAAKPNQAKHPKLARQPLCLRYGLNRNRQSPQRKKNAINNSSHPPLVFDSDSAHDFTL